MNPRITHQVRAAIAVALGLSMSSAQSASTRQPPECNSDVVYRVNSDSRPTTTELVRLRELCAQDYSSACSCLSNTTTCRPCPPQTSQEPARPEETPPSEETRTAPTRHDDHEDGRGHAGLAALFEALGRAIVTAGELREPDRQTGPQWVTTDQLDADGPRFPMQQQSGRFQVQGYAAAGWPFVADIQTEPGTWTWLELSYKGSNRPQYVDLTRPEGGRRTEVFNLPGAPGSFDIARYSIHSALLRQGYKPLYRPMRVFGLGAGPRAVGSIDQSSADDGNRSGPDTAFLSLAAMPRQALKFYRLAAQTDPGAALYLSVIAFGPTPETNPANVTWAVSARRKFAKSRIEVLLVPPRGEGIFTSVTQANIDLFRSGHVSGKWGTLPALTRIGPGWYSLQARAWRIGADGGDWTGASSYSYVQIR
jgi:hypothetical protein